LGWIADAGQALVHFIPKHEAEQKPTKLLADFLCSD